MHLRSTSLVLIVGLATFCLSCATSGPSHRPEVRENWGATAVDYSLWVDSDVEFVVVEVCAEGRVSAFRPAIASARHSLRSARQVLGPRVMDLDVDDDGTVRVLDDRDPCVHLRIDVADAARRSVSPFVAFRFKRATTIAPDILLWRPVTVREDVKRTLRIQTAPGVNYSVPWPLGRDGRYQVSSSTFHHLSLLAFGDFDSFSFTAAGVEVHAAVMGAMEASPGDLEVWLKESVRTVATATGDFPVERLQVLIFPFPFFTSSKPIAFGMAARGGGAAAYFVANEGAAGHRFLGEWVAVHEMSHLVLPFVAKRDAWLSEGLATYHQNVLRARAGLLTENEGWFELVEGIVMAEEMAKESGAAIGTTSATMAKTRKYRQVYWVGATYALLLDVNLRLKSKDNGGLSTSLYGLNTFALSEEEWSARRILDFIDDKSKTNVGQTVAEQANNIVFPDVWPILKRLGVTWTGDAVELDDSAELVRIRKAIMAPRVPTIGPMSTSL